MTKKWIITFENGYCGCDQEEEFEGTYEEAVGFAEEQLSDYAESMAHAAFGWDEEPDPEEYDNYVENCYYTITESEDEE